MVELVTIKEWIRAEYNEYIRVFVKEDHVRFTNGSGGHAIDIYPHGNSLVLEGERGGETIATSCDATKDTLLSTLSKHV